jgi:two-component system, cell cycle sensor histidine kinase and response regulator CckA
MRGLSLVGSLVAASAVDDPALAVRKLAATLEHHGISVEPDNWLESTLAGELPEGVLLTASPPLSNEETSSTVELLRLSARRCHERAELQQTRERLELLSSASFEGIMVHESGSLIDANQRLSEILGYGREELLGPRTMERCVAKEDFPRALTNMQSRYEGAYTIWGVRKDGSRFRAELQAKQGLLGQRPVRVVAVRDVTERERREQELQESEQRFRNLARAVFDVIVSSKEGTIIEASGQTEEVLGYPAEKAVGRHILEFVDRDQFSRVQSILSEQRLDSYETMVRRPDGTTIPVEITPIVGSLGGSPTRVSGVRDLRKQKQEQAERLALEYRIAQSQRVESLSVLAGGIAHDFNNLLLGMMGHTEHMLSAITDPSQRAALEAILAGGERAAALTAQMLAYAGRKEVGEREPIDVSAMISETGELLSAALSKKARVVLTLESNARVMGNRATLNQVLMSLLINASDALADNVGVVEVAVRTVERMGERWKGALNQPSMAGCYVEIDVKDDGVGMTTDVIARVFDPFFTTKGKGRGLGLAAALGIVRGHGGALLVQSKPGAGSCFSILLPAAQLPSRSEPPRAAPIRGGAKVMVVDDEPLVLSFLERCLRNAGYAVVAAGDGASALARSRQEVLDLVVLDMTMPDMDGGQVLRQLRAEGNTMPVVLSSGYVDAAVERGLDQDDFQGFLHKPFRVASLLETVSRVLGARRCDTSE